MNLMDNINYKLILLSEGKTPNADLIKSAASKAAGIIIGLILVAGVIVGLITSILFFVNWSIAVFPAGNKKNKFIGALAAFIFCAVIGGAILGFQIYGYINPIITRYTTGVSNDTLVLMFIKIITLLGGIMFLMVFPTLVEQFKGESLSMREAQQALGFVTGKAMRMNPVDKLSSKANSLRKNSQG